MLNIKKSLGFFEKILLVSLVFLSFFTFYVRYKMYDISKSLSHLDRKIESLNNEKDLLVVELTYLTSTERILSLIEKDANILNEKGMIVSSQLKSGQEFTKIALAKADEEMRKDRKVASSK